ncbi:hypothetical protein [Paenibacillus sp. Marseille-Q4541]|uniref:hypothetical protein n=1 Tax=Paenibacillus sp. Marseille-Q4541 TaxID=2831522 RepID=UPI001BA84246|nr:hypothetical protein [Paenibacillus sp. Marseille-Q4541]
MKISIFSLLLAVMVWTIFSYLAFYGGELDTGKLQMFYAVLIGSGVGFVSSVFGFYKIQRKTQIWVTLAGMIMNGILFLILGYILILAEWLRW